MDVAGFSVAKRAAGAAAWLAFLTAVAAPSVAAAAAAKGSPGAQVLVMDLENLAAGVLAAPEVEAASEELRAELSRASKLRVLGPKDVADLLKLHREKQLLGCSEPSCMSALAQLAGVGRLVTGSIARVGGHTLVQVRLFDADRAVVLRRISQRGGAELLQTVQLAARRLLAQAGTVHLINQVDGAEVFLGGDRVGEMPLKPFEHEELGDVELRVEHVDYPTYRAQVHVAPGATTRHVLKLRSWAELESAAATRRAWGWGLLGGAALAGGASAVLFREAFASHDRYESLDPRAASAEDFDAWKRRTEQQATWGWATAGVGTALAVGSVWLLLTSSDPAEEAVAVLPGAAPGGAGLFAAGRF